ncbi:cyclase family protein [Pleionea litopenaei]|uniref:Cyclase family protein n=1 Tax=Pleionea litopenaei TaxID=3070815 RepID=A0AA51X8N1_9GAMM|nr:cyclase family protein [Pleionea sp. HL-JVS1]WMS89156.1 cyclase family protein [Pleionea sp. HL-JVS1]
MKMRLSVEGHDYRVDMSAAINIAIPLSFDQAQPNHFGAEYASAEVLQDGEFIGDTTLGGSCNVRRLHITPHCNGTHTESVSHIVNQPIAVGQLAQSLLPATLITVIPSLAKDTFDSYTHALTDNDKVISKSALVTELSSIDSPWVEALIVRTLPNEEVKKTLTYNNDNQPPFFTHDAIDYLIEKGVKHLIVDFPSIDKMYDHGLLSNHRRFWNVAIGIHAITEHTRIDQTITELAFIANDVNDGHYLLSLNIAPFETDAAPSRPVLYPMELLND